MVHTNSRESYREEAFELDRRSKLILKLYIDNPDYVFTDRNVMVNLNFKEPNDVRPNITRMVQAGILEEVAVTSCAVTGKTVRMTGLALGPPPAPLPATSARRTSPPSLPGGPKPEPGKAVNRSQARR